MYSRRVIGVALLVGVGGGAVGSAYLLGIHLLQHVLDPVHWSSTATFVVLGLTGLAVFVIARLLGSPGDVELLVDNIHVSGAPSNVRSLRSRVPMSRLTISAGGAAGPQAPLVTTCGTLAGWLGRRLRLGMVEARSVTIAGMAAAFTVLFGAPLGSALFSLEILHRRGLQYHEALVPSIAGALTGYACHAVLSRAGLAPIWQIPFSGELYPRDLLWALGAGVVGALIAVVFTYLVVGLRRAFEVVPRTVRAVLGGLALAALALWSPYALTFGEIQTKYVLVASIATATLAVAIVAKLLATSVTVASGWPGGFIIPLFFVGAALGQLTHNVFIGANAGVMCAALMAAANVGVTKTLLGSTLVVTEMGGIRLLPTTLLAATVAFLLTSEVGLIHSQREREPMDEL